MKKEIIEDLIEKIGDYEDCGCYGCDLAYLIFSMYNSDESITYNTEEAREWVIRYYNEIGDIVRNIENIPCPFNETEKFMVVIYLEVAGDCLLSCEMVEKNWDNKMCLDKKTIDKIKEELAYLI